MADGAPETLFHYTSAEGLLGILRPYTNDFAEEIPDRAVVGSFSLRATDARFLNDRTELRHAARAIADEVAKTMHGNNVDHLVQKIREADFSTGEYGTANPIDQSTFVTCFSASEDSLSQWRGYAGGGYAVEFYKSALDQMVFIVIDDEDGPIFPVQSEIEQVHYDLTREEIEASALRICSDWASPGPWGFMAVAANEVARFKHEAFREEREWRQFITGPTSRLSKEFRTTSAGLIVPYITAMSGHSSGERPIEAVWVGPSENPSQRVKAVEMVLEQFGLRYPVKVSAAPFRG